MFRDNIIKLLMIASSFFAILVQSEPESFWSNLRFNIKKQTAFKEFLHQEEKAIDPYVVKGLLSYTNGIYRSGLLTIAAGTKNRELMSITLPNVKHVNEVMQALDTAHYCKNKNMVQQMLIYNTYEYCIKAYQQAGVLIDQEQAHIIMQNYEQDDSAFKKAFLKFKNQQRDDLKQQLYRISQSSDQAKEKSQTEELLEKIDQKYPDYTMNYCCNKNVQGVSNLLGTYGEFDAIVAEVIKIEQDDAQNGYTTFFHGRNWEWNYVNDVWNIICALRDKKDVVFDFISMRQRDVDCDVQSLRDYRKHLVDNGNTGSYVVSATNQEGGCGAEVTFLNYTGLSHSDDVSLCSMSYVLGNYSCGSGYATVQRLLEKYGLEVYQNQFDQLYKQHFLLSNCGELLCISVANKKIDDIVWPAVRGGYRYSQQKASEVVAECRHRIKDSSNGYIQQNLCTVLWEDCPIFCAGALSIPGEGEDVVKIRSIHVADKEKYLIYQNQRYKLFKNLQDQGVVPKITI